MQRLQVCMYIGVWPGASVVWSVPVGLPNYFELLRLCTDEHQSQLVSLHVDEICPGINFGVGPCRTRMNFQPHHLRVVENELESASWPTCDARKTSSQLCSTLSKSEQKPEANLMQAEAVKNTNANG